MCAPGLNFPCLIGVVSLIVVGPKDLPRVLSQITKYIRKARGIAREFQSSIDEVVRQADLEAALGG